MFYDKFKQLCEQRGVSCNKAAFEIGLSNATPTKWKKTGATPGGETLDKIAAYFSVSTDYLLGKEQKNSPPSRPEPTEREARILDALRSKSPAEQKALLTLLGIFED